MDLIFDLYKKYFLPSWLIEPDIPSNLWWCSNCTLLYVVLIGIPHSLLRSIVDFGISRVDSRIAREYLSAKTSSNAALVSSSCTGLVCSKTCMSSRYMPVDITNRTALHGSAYKVGQRRGFQGCLPCII
jgi:hypothetical protein